MSPCVLWLDEFENLSDENISSFVNDLQDYSGADIEGILVDARRIQNHQKDQESIDSIINRCISNTYPISMTLRNEVEAMRKEFTYRRFENVNMNGRRKEKKKRW